MTPRHNTRSVAILGLTYRRYITVPTVIAGQVKHKNSRRTTAEPAHSSAPYRNVPSHARTRVVVLRLFLGDGCPFTSGTLAMRPLQDTAVQ